MKKNVGKKFRLMALLASLTLVLWGGVIACSNGSDDDGDDTPTTTLPTAVVLNNRIDGSNWTDTSMTKSETDGIWTCEMTLSEQWPNFNVKATFGEKEVWYKGEKGGTQIELDKSATILIAEDDSGDIWCDVGEDNKNAKILVTVDFTGDNPTIKITLVKEGADEKGDDGNGDADEGDGEPGDNVPPADDGTTGGETTIIESKTVTMESSPIEFISAANLSALKISSLTITATEAKYTGDSKDDWSFKIYTSTDWGNETELKWSADISGYEITISDDDDDFANFKSSGIFVYGWPTDISAKITVTYK